MTNEKGRFGVYGGQYIPETLMNAVIELEKAYDRYCTDQEFQSELTVLLNDYAGRPSRLYYAEKMTKNLGGAKIYLKREDLNHTGAHKINNVLGQALLAKRMGKTRLIASAALVLSLCACGGSGAASSAVSGSAASAAASSASSSSASGAMGGKKISVMTPYLSSVTTNQMVGGKGTVVALTHRPHPGVVKRCEAFDELLAAQKSITLVTEQHVPAEQPINDAQDIVENLLTANPEKGSITAIWCGWDEPAIGATQACQEAGRDEILVVGVDGNGQAVSLIKGDTNLKATVAQNFQGMVDIVVDQMGKLFAGQTIQPGDMYAEATLITKENAG